MLCFFFDFADMADDDFYLKRGIYDKNGELVACNPLYINGRLDYLQILRKHSRLIPYLYTKIGGALERIRLLGFKDYMHCILKGKRVKVAIRERGDLKNAQLDRLFMFRENKDKEVIRYYWENSARWIDKIREFLNNRSIEFILVAYPYPLQVSPTAWQGGREMWQFEENKVYDSPLPFEFPSEYAKKNNVKFINLWQHLLRYSSENLYYDWNGHWTPLGNKRVAEGICANPIFLETIKYDK